MGSTDLEQDMKGKAGWIDIDSFNLISLFDRINNSSLFAFTVSCAQQDVK